MVPTEQTTTACMIGNSGTGRRGLVACQPVEPYACRGSQRCVNPLRRHEGLMRALEFRAVGARRRRRIMSRKASRCHMVIAIPR